MTIVEIAILACIAIVVGWLGKGRKLALLAVSALVLYWLQPRQEPVNLMFWLPTLTLIATGLSWFITADPESRSGKENCGAAIVLLGVIVFVDLNRFFQLEWFFPVETPRFQWIALAVVAVLAITFFLRRLEKFNRMALTLTVVGLIGLFFLIKTPSLSSWLLESLAAIRGKEAGGQSALTWLGFSYVSFRILHTIFDRLAGRLPSVSLAEYVNYVIFFPPLRLVQLTGLNDLFPG